MNMMLNHTKKDCANWLCKLFDWSDRHSSIRSHGPSGVRRHLPTEPVGVGEIPVEATKVSSLRGFQDRRPSGPGGVEDGDYLVFGVDHLGEGERSGSGRRGARPADVGFEGGGVEDGQQEAVADLDEGDLPGHIEGGWPAESLDV